MRRVSCGSSHNWMRSAYTEFIMIVANHKDSYAADVIMCIGNLTWRANLLEPLIPSNSASVGLDSLGHS